MDAGKLYVVATPIGNLKDITLRALEILEEVDLIAAEDTRHSSILMKHYNISTRLISYHEHSGERKTDEIIANLLSGKSIALVSDAGTPLISDPGYPLVSAAREAGIEVVCIPGACAAVAALSAVAVGDGRFVFWGFLDAKSSVRKKQIEKIKELGMPVVFYESPHRLLQTLQDILTVCGGEARIVIARELTKIYEEYYCGSIIDAIAEFEKRDQRGEFVLILECPQQILEVSDTDIKEMLQECLAEKMSKKDAVAEIARRLNLPKNKVYKVSLG
ncbi:MAG: 16S rRNA (cytidine(1402)-2'-O)-methyltransferase [Eubacteriales bacterium]